jgi:hypothetical protein
MSDAAAVPPPFPSVTSAPRRGIGTAGFVLSLLAFAGDIIGGIVLVVSLVSSIGDVATMLQGRSAGFSGVAVGFVTLVLLGLGGTVLAIVGVILGIVAAARGRGRVLGVLAIILGALVLITRILGIVLIATSGGSGSS